MDGLVAGGGEMIRRRLTAGGTAVGAISVVHALGAAAGFHDAGRHVREASRTCARSNLGSLVRLVAQGGGVLRRGLTVGATAEGAVMVEIAREHVKELHSEDREVKKRKERQNVGSENVQTRRE